MKLNPDCVREVLMALEGICNGHSVYIFNAWEEFRESFSSLKKYSVEELEYHVRQCNQTGFLYKAKMYPVSGFSFVDITPDAHEFLANIRSETNWNKSKEIFTKIGSSALSVIKEVAKDVAIAAATNYLGIN